MNRVVLTEKEKWTKRGGRVIKNNSNDFIKIVSLFL